MAMSYEQWLVVYQSEKARIEGQITNLTGKQKREAERVARAQRVRLDKFRAGEAKRKEVHAERDLEREAKDYIRDEFGF